MHPPLALHKHPACKAQILALQVCHSEHPLAKFVGVCNEAKYALDKCFREEVRHILSAHLSVFDVMLE